MHRALVRALALSFAVLAACSSSDGSSSSTDDAGGSSSPEGGSPGDAASDAPVMIVDSGGGPTDAQTDAPLTGGCNGSTLKLCEDFDTSMVGKTPNGWTVLNGYASSPSPMAVVASDEFHSGPYSVKTSSAVAGAYRIQKSLSTLGATAGTHWGRVWFKVKSPAPQLTSQGPHATFVALQGNLRAGELRVVDTQQATTGKIQLLVNTPDDNCCKGTDFSYTIWDGQWHCSEWYVDHVTQSYRYFLDSTEVTALAFDYGAGSTTANMPNAFTAVGLGTIFYTPTLPSDLVTWFDDLAIDDKQIGCK